MRPYFLSVSLAVVLLAGCGGHTDDQSQATSAPTDAVTASADDQQSATPAADARAKRAPEATAKPESYEHQRQREKREFLSSVDESISGAMIAGNKFKYVGQRVDIHCTVMDIPDRSFFNANCGSDDESAVVVIEYDATDLSPGQAVRIIGTVAEPMEGNNAMGGTMQFPTVKAEFME